MALSPKHQQFINEYIDCWNQTEAYRRVYPNSSYEAARANARRLIANDSISAEIQRRIAENAMKPNEVLARLAEQARGAHGEYITPDGFNLPHMIADRKGYLIKSLKETKQGQTIEFYDAQAALKLLGQHLGLFDQPADGDDDELGADWWKATDDGD